MPDDDAWMLYDLAREDRRTRARLAKAQTASQKQLAKQEATFTGALTDVFESKLAVGIYTENGGIHRGIVAAIDAEFIEVHHVDQPKVLIAVDCIRGLEITDIPRRDVIPSARALPENGGLALRLTGLAEIAPTVRIQMKNVSDPFTGLLLSAGADVISIGDEPRARTLQLLPISAISEIKILG